MKKHLTSRLSYSFSLNETTEKDIINILNELGNTCPISLFVKAAISFFNSELENALDAEDVSMNAEDRKKEKMLWILDEVNYYKISHNK